jgi:hypothetical protein
MLLKRHMKNMIQAFMIQASMWNLSVCPCNIYPTHPNCHEPQRTQHFECTSRLQRTQQFESFSWLHCPGGAFFPLILPLGRQFWASMSRQLVKRRMTSRRKLKLFILSLSLFFVIWAGIYCKCLIKIYMFWSMTKITLYVRSMTSYVFGMFWLES